MKAFLKFFMLSLPSLLLFDRVPAQNNYYLKSFTTEHGLPNNNIRSITQDQTGFLWIASWDGVSRYDGYEFKNYFHIPGDTTSLPYFSALKICVDRQNNVWILTDMLGFCKYDRAKDNFRKVFSDKNPPHIYDITLDTLKNLWIGTSTCFLKYNAQKATFQKFTFSKPLTGKYYFGKITFDNEGNLWLLNKTLVQCKVLSHGKIQIHKEFKITQNIPDWGKIRDLFYQVYISRNKSAWYFSNQNVFMLDTIQYEFRPFKGNLNKLGTRHPALVWSENGIGLKLLNGNNELIELPASDCPNPNAVFIDNDRSLWFGCISEAGVGMGLKRLVETPGMFSYPLNDLGYPPNQLSVNAILKDKNGSVWAGSRGIKAIFEVNKNGIAIHKVLPESIFTRAQTIRSMIEDSAGIFFGYQSNLLLRHTFRDGSFRKVLFTKPEETEKDSPVLIHSLVQKENGHIIIGSYGIFDFNPQNGKLFKVFRSEVNPVYTIIKDKTGNFWVGKNTRQLMQFDKDFKFIRNFQLSENHFNIEHLCEGNNHDMWITTLGGGIFHLDLKTGEKMNLSTANGLANNTTYSILKDRRGNLWITTDHGISLYNPVSGKFRNIGFTDGLLIEEFNSDGSYLAADGEMFFGGMGGLVRFYPENFYHLETINYKAHLILTDLKVSGTSRFFPEPVYESDTVILNKGDNNLQVSFSALNLRDPDKIKYRYQLSHHDKNWIETDYQHRFVNYSNLRPGKYLLKIEASDNLGDWMQSRQVSVVIPPEIYQTFVFKSGIIFLILLALSGIIFVYFRQLNLKNKNIQNQLKLESLRGQMNPHFIFNSLNSINYFISKNDSLSANRYIADFAKLIRSILNNTAVNYITLAEEIDSLRDYLSLEYLRFGEKFDYSLEIDPELDCRGIQIFPGMIQPFIENSLWHGVRPLEERKGKITIRFLYKNENCLQCIVEDDGIGRKLAAERRSRLHGKSRGISIVQERVKVYNNLRNTDHRIILEDCYPDQKETGTRVIIDIPVKTD